MKQLDRIKHLSVVYRNDEGRILTGNLERLEEMGANENLLHTPTHTHSDIYANKHRLEWRRGSTHQLFCSSPHSQAPLQLDWPQD